MLSRSRATALAAVVAALGALIPGALGSAALSALLARPAEAATVFSNYNGVKIPAFANGFYAEGFTPTASYDFIGAAAFMFNQTPTSQPFPMALYSSTSAGAPDASLWTSGTLYAPGGPSGAYTLVTATYSGSPILLRQGIEYFLAVDVPNFNLGWAEGGSSSAPFYSSPDGGISWTSGGPNDLQFEVSGAVIPEPATWAMLMIGFAGLGFAGYRRASARPSPSLA